MIKAKYKNIHKSVSIGDNFSIDCEKVTIGKYSKIGFNSLENFLLIIVYLLRKFF